MGVKEDLIAARKLIADGKWAKRPTCEEDGYCIVTACHAAIPDSAMRLNACYALWEQLPDSERSPSLKTVDLMIFNDEPATTRSDILALFDRAINAA